MALNGKYDWDLLRNMYDAGIWTVPELERMFDMPTDYLRKQAKAKGWPEAKKKGKPGRRPIYNPDTFPDIAYIACSQGFSDRKLAKLFGVSNETIQEWKRLYPDFSDQLTQGKDEYDAATAETCLLKRLKGFRYTEKTREPVNVLVRKSGNQTVREIEAKAEEDLPQLRREMMVTKTVTKMVVPDTSALMFFLCNRQPDRWKHINRMEHSGPGGKAIPVSAADLVSSLFDAVDGSTKHELPNQTQEKFDGPPMPDEGAGDE